MLIVMAQVQGENKTSSNFVSIYVILANVHSQIAIYSLEDGQFEINLRMKRRRRAYSIVDSNQINKLVIRPTNNNDANKLIFLQQTTNQEFSRISFWSQ